jgi:hypothetical protein
LRHEDGQTRSDTRQGKVKPDIAEPKSDQPAKEEIDERAREKRRVGRVAENAKGQHGDEDAPEVGGVFPQLFDRSS